jgi:putative nucleotidyltransferase with HDIG domain
MDLKKTIQQVESLPSPDFVLQKIVNTANSPSASAKDLNEVASKDPAFVAKILKLANSAYYGLPRNVSKLTEAIMILGFKTVRNMALSIFTNKEFFAFKSDELDLKEFWKHSIVVATIGELTAEIIGYSNKEELFMCGLLHDIGKSVQGVLFPSMMDAIVKLARIKKISYYAAEQLLEIPTHEIFAEILVEKWNFPELVLISASRHHRPDSLRNSIYSDPVNIITLSTFIAERLFLGDNGGGRPIAVPKYCWDELGFTPVLFDELLVSVEAKVQKIDEFMNIQGE